MNTKKENLYVYSIGHVMDRTGLSARQIRYYEEVGLISPRRTSGNQRRFSEKDIRRLLRIKQLLAENLTTEAIKEVIKSEEQTYHDSTRPVPPVPPQTSLPLKSASERRYMTSLYPVSNPAVLERLLQERRKDE